jgi:hypothetical protein
MMETGVGLINKSMPFAHRKLVLARPFYSSSVFAVFLCSFAFNVTHSPGKSSRELIGGGCNDDGLLLYCDFAQINDKGVAPSARVYELAPEMPKLLAAIQKWILLQTESAGKSSGVVVFA